MAKLFDYIEITYDKLTDQMEVWLKDTYQKSGKVFSHLSPSGMIMHIQKVLFNNNMLYLKNALRQIDIQSSSNERVIRNAARISGHNPSRSISAIGTIKLRLKVGINVIDNIKGSKIIVMNHTKIKNKSNSLFYTINTGDSIKNVYDINPYTDLYFSVEQGKYETQKYTGNATKNQSIAVVVNRDQTIDNFNFSVYYNGVLLKIVDSLYDMLPNEYACYTMTGFDGGLDIYFGTDDHGFVPSIGSYIQVSYLVTDGSDGNILTNLINDFTFEDDVFDSDGNVLNMDELFDIYIHNDINFGTDGESITYTKSVIPNVSRNFVLSTPKQFIYHLKRLNMFSKVNAYNLLDINNIDNNKYIDAFITETFGDTIDVDYVREKMEKYFPIIYDNQIYIYLIPKIENYFVGEYNYFNIPFDVFYLDNQEIDKVMGYLKRMGTISITTNIVIIQPEIRLYVANVYVRRFRDDVTDNITNQIIDVISNYFIYNERFDRIVKSDLIRTLKNEIESIDSINVEFVSKKNEDYHNKKSRNIIPNVLEDNIKIVKQNEIYVKSQYNPNVLFGIDPIQGDIVVEKDELAVLRGGWCDRDGVFYNDIPTPKGLSTINIMWTGTYDEIYATDNKKASVQPNRNLTRQVTTASVNIESESVSVQFIKKSTN